MNKNISLIAKWVLVISTSIEIILFAWGAFLLLTPPNQSSGIFLLILLLGGIANYFLAPILLIVSLFNFYKKRYIVSSMFSLLLILFNPLNGFGIKFLFPIFSNNTLHAVFGLVVVFSIGFIISFYKEDKSGVLTA